eukprot:scaffold18013_cov48-Cyclotella_meneghiniana.AAC.5
MAMVRQSYKGVARDGFLVGGLNLSLILCCSASILHADVSRYQIGWRAECAPKWQQQPPDLCHRGFGVWIVMRT